MEKVNIEEVVEILKDEIKKWRKPSVTEIAEKTDPFRILISTVISLRTKDEVTREASERLFSVASTPEKISLLSEQRIAGLIYPAGFYNRKASTIKKISQIILNRYSGQVPRTFDGLLGLPGVGRKTANLVYTLGFGKRGICVDTHVHRIVNRLGYVKTKTPEKTEKALREKLPENLWIELNDILVTFGQNICTPVSPWCSKCPVYDFCLRVGVGRRR